MEITKAAKIPQITPASSNVAVTQSGNDYIYQLTATDELHMRNVMGYMVDENNAKTFAILYESSDFGTGGFKIASTVCDDFGLEMVDSEVYNSGDTDFSVPLGKGSGSRQEVQRAVRRRLRPERPAVLRCCVHHQGCCRALHC